MSSCRMGSGQPHLETEDNAVQQLSAHGSASHKSAYRSRMIACKCSHTQMTQSSSPLVQPRLADYSLSSSRFPSTESASPPSHNNTSHPPTPRTSHKVHHDTAFHTHAPHNPAALHASPHNSTHAHNPYPCTFSEPPIYHRNTSSSVPFYHTACTVQHDRSGHKDAGTSCFYRRFGRMNVVVVLGPLLG